jgi:hypothetical protein
MTIAQARRYMVELINRDRASMGLAPVTLDEGAATRAGQGHAEDMAENGYLGHWGLDGSVPEERYTAAGGADMVLENASCFTDEQHRMLDAAPAIDPAQIEHTESMFFHEVAPNDGHRKNILKAWHKKVGIGIAQPRATPTEIPVPCISQEFTDAYGTYHGLPGSRISAIGSASRERCSSPPSRSASGSPGWTSPSRSRHRSRTRGGLTPSRSRTRCTGRPGT